jgi:hypothetical protein
MRTALVLVLLVGVGPAAVAQESARAVIERAIAAHGGREKLSRARADRARMRGVVHIGKDSVLFTSEVTVHLPRRYRSVVQMRDGDQNRTIVNEIDGDKVVISIDGKPQQVEGLHLNQLRQMLALESALRLVPLLDRWMVKLTHLGEFEMNKQTVIGIGVKGREQQRELKLYFDKQSGLLVKAEQLIDGVDKDICQEAYYRDHREVAGYLRPGRAAVYRDGKKVMEAELIDVVRLD